MTLKDSRDQRRSDCGWRRDLLEESDLPESAGAIFPAMLQLEVPPLLDPC